MTKAVCNRQQVWNDDKCKCDCREDLIEKMICDKGYAFNPSTCKCDCDKSCGIGEYLDYKSCVCKNSSMIDRLIEECTSVIEGDKIYSETLNTISSNDCASCSLYIVLFTVFLTISVIIGGVFVYFHWYKKINN